METKRFAKNDQGFVCGHCGKEVDPLRKTSRNHCPYCLWSRHLDENPGDRLSTCGGLMEPVGAYPDPRKGYVIVHRCTVCGKVGRNKAAYGGGAGAGRQDDLKKIIELCTKQF